jgi:hypothetical protein
MSERSRGDGSARCAYAERLFRGEGDVILFRYRVDGRDVEPGAGVHEGQPRLQAMLRRDVLGAVRGVPGHPFENGFDLRLVPEKLAEPLRWRSPKTIFVNSMGGLFHERVSDEYIEAVATVMELANWHTFQVLTKRSERMSELLRGPLRRFGALKHVWWGVSVEDRKYAMPAARRRRRKDMPLLPRRATTTNAIALPTCVHWGNRLASSALACHWRTGQAARDATCCVTSLAEAKAPSLNGSIIC